MEGSVWRQQSIETHKRACDIAFYLHCKLTDQTQRSTKGQPKHHSLSYSSHMHSKTRLNSEIKTFVVKKQPFFQKNRLIGDSCLASLLHISQMLHLTTDCWNECKLRLNLIMRSGCFNHEKIYATLRRHPPPLPAISKAQNISLENHTPGPCVTFWGFHREK